ncbi:hypothetical protein K491DRAFT_623686 [Lophiostoma macrostomum CBS 122681]|uniref:Cytochrome P450 n=1 Tax=Lophiostoma macrostomum CBS 122681 TaxID=1314788 RepID=A0A6A6TG42_9PLEO|nr:hypothetical protein K491DRAFT_623686 [Lophiostoma macrostomum CBS 122681]
MVSSKSVFLGVHASNGVIRRLFYPACLALTISPLVLLVLRYFNAYQQILDHIPSALKTSETWLQISIAVVWSCLVTRVLSGRNSNGGSTKDGKRRVQQLPYWIPSLRHWTNVFFGGEQWLKAVRESSITNIVAYNTAGAKHNIVFSPALLDQILGHSASLEEADLTRWVPLRNAFGMPNYAKTEHEKLRVPITEKLGSEIFHGQQLKAITLESLHILSQSLPDLMTFNSSMVDQLPWERVAGVELTDGTDEAECDLYALINEFICSIIFPPISGSHFPESYQLLGSDLAAFNQSYYALAAGYPSHFPLSGLPGANLAKKRLSEEFRRFFDELTYPPAKKTIEDDESVSGGEEETDAETPTPLSALNELFSKHDLPMQMRAAIPLQALHEIVSQAVPLAFWTLLHVYSSSTLPEDASSEQRNSTPVSQIRQETKTWAEATQPPSVHPMFPSPPEIKFTSQSQLFNPSSLTYLRSSIFEARRLYSASITTAKVTKPIIFTDPASPNAKEEYQLDVGSYIDIGLSQRLINTSGANYLSPEKFDPERFAHSQSPSPLFSTYANESDELVTALLIALVAGITQLWDIKPAPAKGLWQQMVEAQAEASGQEIQKKELKAVWRIPKAVDGSSVMVPKGDVRVRVRRREGLDRPSTSQKVG